MTHPPVCDYEGSDYQDSFWNQGGREYEDRTEAIALRRLLPESGVLLLELGAGAGRNTPRYAGFERIVLLDYSRTQLEQAQGRLAKSANEPMSNAASEQGSKSAKEQSSKSASAQGSQRARYIFVAADAYRLPFVDGLFDTATMIRTLHHMADAPKALAQVRNVLRPGGIFVLEFANKLNLKAILRYLTGRQSWNPFNREPVEFATLNFDFHPTAVRGWLTDLGFQIDRTLALSYLRIGLLKRLMPTGILVFLDSLLQWTGALFQLSPSVFLRARWDNAYDLSETKRATIKAAPTQVIGFFKCPECGLSPLEERNGHLACPGCKRNWAVKDGIYDFRKPSAG